jgi:excisionase family DNA binding protein
MKSSRPKGSKDQQDPPLDPRSEAPVMDAPEVCDYLSIHRSTLYRLIKRGEIPYFRIGSDYRFNREAIDEWMKRKPKGQ